MSISNQVINRVIHPDDFMFDFLLTRKNGDRLKAEDEYFGGGQYDANMLLESVGRMGLKFDECRVLEFASGYGRVTRHLPRGLGNYMASDIHPEAVKYQRNELETNCIQSSVFFDKFSCKFKFDFIFVLSLFSHLPEESFGGWLETLHGLLEPGGHLLITTHGEFATTVSDFLLKIYDSKRGYGFKSDSEQKDLDASAYGTTVTGPQFVIEAVRKIRDARIVSFRPGCWFGLQDEWVISKIK